MMVRPGQGGAGIRGTERDADSGEGEGEGEGEGAAKRRISRRALIQAAVIGGAGVAALPLLALVGSITRTSQQPTNLTYSLNTNWLFGGQYMSGSESVFYDDSGFAPITLPHTVAPLSWRNWDMSTWEQVWIYRRHFSGAHLLNVHSPGNRIFVDFDGVMVNATVVINDQTVSSHQGGYLPWSAELTGQVTAGDNLLAVIVDGRNLAVPPMGLGSGPKSIDFFQPGGIYRDVSLRVMPQVFLSDLFALPVDVLSPQRQVNVECTIDSAAAANVTGTLLVELLSGTQEIAAQSTPVSISSPGTTTTKLRLTGLGPVSLWSTENPNLYTVQATLTIPGVGSHVLTRRIGFREASFRPDGFYLNGSRLQLFGLNRHQLYPYTGMAMPARVQRRDAEILKNEFNCNMVRCSHYPQSPDFLDACDELGLLVWEEAPGWHNVSTNPAWQNLVLQNVRDMVTRDRSRPSVVIWGTRLNETPDLPALWAATRQAAAELDGSRPSSGAMAPHSEDGWNEDVFAYNDYGVNPINGNATLRPPFPGVPYLITEAVGVEEARPEHFAWTDPPGLLVKQATLHAQAQNMARSDARYSGLLAWAGFDYASLQSQLSDAIKWAGIADGFRVPKPGAAIYQSQVDPGTRPVIIPVFFWELGGALPTPAPDALIASNCDRLEIFIGGTHVASAQPASDSPLYDLLPYPPFLVTLPAQAQKNVPELLIEGYLSGRQVSEVRMSSDPLGDSLSMAADDATILADGSDATRVVFRAIDAYGNQRRYMAGNVTMNLTGPAVIVGDNPFAFGEYGGLGAVWIRSLVGQQGTITLTAAHPLLGQAQVRLRAQSVSQANVLA
jgi:beta-galactosidase